MFSSVVGGGVEQILDMEISEFILWSKLAREFKCVRQEKWVEFSW
uniref:Uncharacterized protein n=1 Tax=Wolbachia endosymbiont of Aleurodicus dispersus TaxID=1288877 RepID=A0A3B0IZQ0_9RICK